MTAADVQTVADVWDAVAAFNARRAEMEDTARAASLLHNLTETCVRDCYEWTATRTRERYGRAVHQVTILAPDTGQSVTGFSPKLADAIMVALDGLDRRQLR